jgi:hypothetical protein
LCPELPTQQIPAITPTVLFEATDSAMDYAEPVEVTPGLTAKMNLWALPTYSPALITALQILK